MLNSRIGIIACLISMSIAVTIGPRFSNAQTRDEKVLRDREAVGSDSSWYYDDVEKGIEAAQASSKPMMVVIRCIP